MPSIHKFGLSVCLCPINAKMAEPIGSEFCVGPNVTLGKVYELSKFFKFVLKDFCFVKFLKCAKNIMKSANFYLFLFNTVQREDAKR